MNIIIENLKKFWWVLVILIVIILIIANIGDKKPETKFDVDAIQRQIENEPKLKENIDSPRNNFKGGNYNLNAGASTINIELDGKKSVISVKSGSLTAMDNGRIKNFRVDADFSSMTEADAAALKTALGIKGSSPAVIQGLTVLPNTVDTAFTVAFSLNALGKDMSFATGIFVEKRGDDSIKISGDINLDKTLTGLATTMKLTPTFVFE